MEAAGAAQEEAADDVGDDLGGRAEENDDDEEDEEEDDGQGDGGQPVSDEVGRLIGEVARLQDQIRRLERERDDATSRLEFVEDIVGPTEAQRKAFQDQLTSARAAALQAHRSGASVPVRFAGRLDEPWLRTMGLSERDCALLQRGCITGSEGLPRDVSLLGDPAFRPYDEATKAPRWEAKGGLLKLTLGDVRDRWGEEVAMEVVRCAIELDKYDASRRLGLEMPWHETEGRELEPGEVIALLEREVEELRRGNRGEDEDEDEASKRRASARRRRGGVEGERRRGRRRRRLGVAGDEEDEDDEGEDDEDEDDDDDEVSSTTSSAAVAAVAAAAGRYAQAGMVSPSWSMLEDSDAFGLGLGASTSSSSSSPLPGAGALAAAALGATGGTDAPDDFPPMWLFGFDRYDEGGWSLDDADIEQLLRQPTVGAGTGAGGAAATAAAANKAGAEVARLPHPEPPPQQATSATAGDAASGDAGDDTDSGSTAANVALITEAAEEGFAEVLRELLEEEVNGSLGRLLLNTPPTAPPAPGSQGRS